MMGNNEINKLWKNYKVFYKLKTEAKWWDNVRM